MYVLPRPHDHCTPVQLCNGSSCGRRNRAVQPPSHDRCASPGPQYMSSKTHMARHGPMRLSCGRSDHTTIAHLFNSASLHYTRDETRSKTIRAGLSAACAAIRIPSRGEGVFGQPRRAKQTPSPVTPVCRRQASGDRSPHAPRKNGTTPAHTFTPAVGPTRASGKPASLT